MVYYTIIKFVLTQILTQLAVKVQVLIALVISIAQVGIVILVAHHVTIHANHQLATAQIQIVIVQETQMLSVVEI